MLTGSTKYPEHFGLDSKGGNVGVIGFSKGCKGVIDSPIGERKPANLGFAYSAAVKSLACANPVPAREGLSFEASLTSGMPSSSSSVSKADIDRESESVRIEDFLGRLPVNDPG